MSGPGGPEGGGGGWTRVFRLLLSVYPADVRRELGPALIRDFRRSLEEAGGHSGSMGRHRRALGELADLLRNLPPAWYESWKRREPGYRRPAVTAGAGGAPWTGVGTEIRHAARALRRRPGYSAAVILTLGMAVGANAAVFSLVDGILLESLPYPDPDALVHISETRPDQERMSVAYPNLTDWREMSRSWKGLAAVRRGWGFRLVDEGTPRLTSGALASANLPDVLGVQPALGRFFTEEEVRRGDRVVLLSHGFWRSELGSDPDVVGSTLTLGDESHRVLGIMPPDPAFPLEDARLVAPLTRIGDRLEERSQYPGIFVIGRLAEEVTLTAARRDMDRVAGLLAERFPGTNHQGGVHLSALKESAVGDADTMLLLLQGAVALVLLIAVANVANLGLVRAVSASRDAGIRMALGARGGRIAGPAILETLLLGLAGGALGLVLASGSVEIMRRTLQGELPRLAAVSLDGSVLLATLGVVLLAIAVAGSAPAVRALRADLAGTLRSGGGRRGGSGSTSHLRNVLIVGEVALTFVVLAGAGLMLRTTVNLLDARLGFDPEDVVTASVPLGSGYPTVESRVVFYRQLLQRLENTRSVESAAGVTPVPLGPGEWQTMISGTGLERVDDEGLLTDAARVTPSYFETMDIPLLAGRSFSGRESMGDPVVMIDETLADRLWPDQDPVGRSFRFWPSADRSYHVIGVVGNTKIQGANQESRTQLYLPYTQGVSSLNLVVRARNDDESAVIEDLRRLVAEMDASIPLTRVRLMEEMERDTRRAESLTTRILIFFAGFSLLLALLGLYGVIAYSVRLRTKEIGIRLALGARAARVARMVLRQGVAMIVIGVALGLVGAMAMTRFLSGLLFEVDTLDPATLGAAAVLLTVLGAAAAGIPALGASRIEPAKTLQEE